MTSVPQITDFEVDGVDQSDSKEQVLGIGPGLLWHISKNAYLFFNAYFESDAENRPEGERYDLRFVYHFYKFAPFALVLSAAVLVLVLELIFFRVRE